MKPILWISIAVQVLEHGRRTIAVRKVIIANVEKIDY